MSAGKSMSGALLTCIRANDTSPASISPTNRTIGATGFLMHQDEMLRKFIYWLLSSTDLRLPGGLPLRVDLLSGCKEWARGQDHGLGKLWNDEALAINWGIKNPAISEKDRIAKKFKEFQSKF